MLIYLCRSLVTKLPAYFVSVFAPMLFLLPCVSHFIGSVFAGRRARARFVKRMEEAEHFAVSVVAATSRIHFVFYTSFRMLFHHRLKMRSSLLHIFSLNDVCETSPFFLNLPFNW